MEKVDVERLALADYMASRRAAILHAWRNAIKRDPALNTGDSLPRVQCSGAGGRSWTAALAAGGVESDGAHKINASYGLSK
jgi:hypothetical protein